MNRQRRAGQDWVWDEEECDYVWAGRPLDAARGMGIALALLVILIGAAVGAAFVIGQAL